MNMMSDLPVFSGRFFYGAIFPTKCQIPNLLKALSMGFCLE